MGITVLGPLSVDGSGRLGPRDRVVLQALATRLGQPLSADELIDAVWGDHPPASAAKNLQSCIVRLRKALGSAGIETAPHGYALVVPADHVDSRDFESQVTRARELLAVGEHDRVAYLLEQALSLWRGPAFPDLPDWPPARREAGRLGEIRLEAEEMHVDALLRSGRPREVLSLAHSMVRSAPLRERRWELLALAQYQTGAQGEALRSLRQLRAVLSQELGIDPAPEMLALEQSILQQDAGLMVPPPRMRGSQCPWQGLQSYDVDDAERFFGRDPDVRACVDELTAGSIVALVGPSGSGKSSIMRAGVLAAMRQRGHKIVVITPGRRPAEALTALPDDADARTVLAVDQTEEVFTLCEDPDERRAFLERLAEEATRRPVILTLRGDRLGQVTEHAGFSRLVERGLHLVGALDEQALHDAVTGPAQQAGLILEPGLVDVLVREVRDDPGALPLLSHALLETWRRREGNTLTVDGYRATGGIHGAVAQSAELLYGQVDTDQRPLLRDLVLRLVSPGIDGEAVRTQVPRRLIAADGDHQRLIEMLVDARLVTSDEGRLEITHEALARAWPRLRGWLDDDVEGQRIRHHLSGAADAWDTLDRPDSELYRGVRLTRALDWQSHTRSALTDTERQFLAAGHAASDAEEQSAAQQVRTQSRLIRRLRIVLSGAVVLLVVALAAGGVAAVQSDRAGDNAEAAELNAAQAAVAATSALAQGAAARGAASGDQDIEMLLATAGVVLDESPETIGNLQQVITRNPALIRSTPLTGKQIVGLDVNPDGRTVALYDDAHSLTILDLETGVEVAQRQIGSSRAEWNKVRTLRISPDGELVAVGAASFSDRLLHLVDAHTLEPAGPQPTGLPRGNWQMMDAKFSQDSSTLAVVIGRLVKDGDAWVHADRRAYVWTLGSSARPQMVDLTPWATGWPSVALSPDGGLLYTASPTLRVHDLRTGGVRTLSEQGSTPYEVTVEPSPDGRFLALARGSLGTDALLLDATTGKVLHTLPHGSEAFDTRFSDDGRRVLTVTYRPTHASVWDTSTGKRIAQFELPIGEPGAVDLDAAGSRVIGATDMSLRDLDVDGARRYLRRDPIKGLPMLDESDVCFVTASQGGEYVAFQVCSPGQGPGTLVGVDVSRRRALPPQPVGGGYGYGGGSWHAPRAEFLVAKGGTIYIYDGQTGLVRTGPHPVGDRVTELDHSPDGSRVVVAEVSGVVTLLDGASLQPVGPPVDVGSYVCCIALGPDNRTAFALPGGGVASNFWNDQVDRWVLVDLETGVVVKEGALGMNGASWVAYSPDGGHVAAAGRDGSVAIIDTASGQLVREPFIAHGITTTGLAFSDDGSRLLSSGPDGSVVLWDTASGSIMARVSLPGDALATPAFLPNGDIMMIPWTEDASVYIWDASGRRAVEFACQYTGRDLTSAEWAQYFPGQDPRPVCPQD